MSAEIEKGPQRRVGKTRHKSSNQEQNNRHSKYLKKDINRSSDSIHHCQTEFNTCDKSYEDNRKTWFDSSFGNHKDKSGVEISGITDSRGDAYCYRRPHVKLSSGSHQRSDEMPVAQLTKAVSVKHVDSKVNKLL